MTFILGSDLGVDLIKCGLGRMPLAHGNSIATDMQHFHTVVASVHSEFTVLMTSMNSVPLLINA
jgi:hypothetical protein